MNFLYQYEHCMRSRQRSLQSGVLRFSFRRENVNLIGNRSTLRLSINSKGFPAFFCRSKRLFGPLPGSLLILLKFPIIFIQPMASDAIFCHGMHLLGSNLNFYWHAMHTKKTRMWRLIPRPPWGLRRNP